MCAEAHSKDSLTGIYSRATLQERLREEVQRARRYKLSFSLILLDLDYFKSINDAFGHRRGDEVLAEFTQRLTTLIRDSDLFFRYGGDEFVLLLPHTPKKQAVLLAERLLEGVGETPFGEKPPIRLSMSMGVGGFPEDAQTPEALFEKADNRHYEAKRSGRGRVVSEDPTHPDALFFEEGGRLIDREHEAVRLNEFLDALPQAGTGLFSVSGPAGSGRTAFLSEAAKAARLRGYSVLSLHGSVALRARAYGALIEALQSWDGLPPVTDGREEFLAALQSSLERKQRVGLLVTVDGLAHLDQPTLDLLCALFQGGEIPAVGLVYVAERQTLRQPCFRGAALQEAVELEPLSREGVRVWLRVVLQWEPPDLFLDWLYQEAGGLPAQLRQALRFLLERGVLRKCAGVWELSDQFAEVKLSARLKTAAQGAMHNLPAIPTSFVGREAEISAAKQLLLERRLVTLIGPGGVGKTRLALQAAAEMLDHFPDGVFFVPLDAVLSPAFLVSTIADVLQCEFRGTEEPKAQLMDYLHDQTLLLVMDNFEHLIEGSALVAEILQAAPGVRVLVTSRERLHLPEEWILELTGLKLPAKDSPEAATASGAVQLFLERARAADSRFALDESTAGAVAGICRSLQGLPLGIELAAPWARMLSCEEIAAGISDNLDLLATERPDIPPRHRSLRGAFEYSWNLLSEEERRVLRKLSVFRGGFLRDAAEQVAGASLLLLGALMDKSLLRRRSAVRYEIHGLLRQYGYEKLSQEPEELTEIQRRHAAYYAGFVQQRGDAVRSSRQKLALEQMAEEIENVRTAWIWAVEQADEHLVDQVADTLYRFHDIRGLFREGEAALAWAIRHLAERQWPGDLLGRLQTRQGLLALRLGQNGKAEELIREGLLISRGLGRRSDLPFSLCSLGDACAGVGKYEEAMRLYEESLAIIHETDGHPYEAARALNNLGLVNDAVGNMDSAKRLYTEGLAMMRATANPWGTVVCLTNLGEVACRQGEYDEAERHFMEGLRGAVELKSEFGILDLLTDIAILMAQRGDRERAVGLLAFVLPHPSLEMEYKEKADALFTELAAQLPTEVVATARVRARSLRLEEVAAEILGD